MIEPWVWKAVLVITVLFVVVAVLMFLVEREAHRDE